MLDGGSGKPTTPTYGSYLSGSTHSPSVPTPITPPSYSAGLIGQPTVPFSQVGSTIGTGTAGTGAATEQKAYAGAWAGSEPIDSYEEFLRNKESAYGSMRDEQTQFYDSQSQKALEAIEAQRQAAISEAENQKNLLATMSQEQRDAVYKFAEEQRISDMNYAAQQYQILLDSINAQRESGMAMATEQRDLLLSMSEEQRNSIYAAAESQRVAAEQRADVERERGVVDARSSYEQNKASYGANAEAMGSMGLSGSGYSDYLNSKAYAQQRAETQAANAQADASKREARYTEDKARMQADSDYYQNKYNAEQAYSDRKYQIDTTYQSNLLNANQSKSQAEHEATSTERETKLSADQTHAQNKYSAESSYSENLFNAESQARSDKLAAEQTADAGKFSAEMSYQENLLNNDDAIGKHRLEEAQKAEEKAAAEAEKAEEDAAYAKNAYYQFLAEANQGNYTVDQITQLAADYGLSAEQTKSLIDAVNGYTTKTEEATKQQQSHNKNEIGGYITGETTDEEIQDYVDDGYISEEDATELKEKRATKAKKEVYQYMNGGDMSTAQSKVESYYKDGVISQKTYQAFYYDASIKNCNSATTAAEALQIEADLKNLKNAGKLSSTDYNNAVNYLYKKFGQTLAPNSYSTASAKNIFGVEIPNSQKMVVTIDGTQYDISTDISGTKGNFVDSDTSKVLSNMVGGSPTNGKLAAIGDTIYVYRTGLGNGNGWVKVNQYSWGTINGTSKGFYDAYKKQFGYQSAPTAPEAGSVPQWKSYEDAAAAGFSNIMTRTEWARRKSSTGRSTYQEYLDKMYAKYVG